MPFWVGRWLPLTDLPLHLGAAAVILHHGDPAWGFTPHFVVEWGELTPYWAYYLALDTLALVMPLETASRVYLSFYALAFPWVGLALCRAFGRSPWLGLVPAPLALGANLYFGFVAYLSGVLLSLVGLALIERERSEPRAARALGLTVLAAALFFLHVQAFVLLLGLALLLAFLAPGPRRSRFRAVIPLFPATGLLLLPWAYLHFLGPRAATSGRYNFGRLGETGARFRSFAENMVGLPHALAGSFQDGSDTILLAFWAGLVAWLIRRGRPARSDRWSLALPLGALAAYFVAPMAMTGQWYINPRFALPAALLLAVLVPARAPSRATGALVLVLTLLTAANAVRQHLRFAGEAAGFDTVLAALPARPRVLGLMRDERGLVMTRWPYAHFPQYAMVRKGGVASRSLAHSPPFPIRHRQAGDFPAPDVFRPDDFDPSRHLGSYDFVLLRGSPPPRLLPAADRVAEAGIWTLWAPRSGRMAAVARQTWTASASTTPIAARAAAPPSTSPTSTTARTRGATPRRP